MFWCCPFCVCFFQSSCSYSPFLVSFHHHLPDNPAPESWLISSTYIVSVLFCFESFCSLHYLCAEITSLGLFQKSLSFLSLPVHSPLLEHELAHNLSLHFPYSWLAPWPTCSTVRFKVSSPVFVPFYTPAVKFSSIFPKNACCWALVPHTHTHPSSCCLAFLQLCLCRVCVWWLSSLGAGCSALSLRPQHLIVMPSI